MTLSLTCALLLAAAPATKTAGAFPFPTKVSTLKNGLTVVRVPFVSPGLISVYTVVRVGSRNEVEAGHTGFAHFFEHMMFRGTRRFPGNARTETMAKLGFAENAFTSDDVTVYHLDGPASGLDTLLDLEADRFLNLEYAEPDFQTEAGAIRGEYQKNAANPSLRIEEATLGAAFTTHPYRHTTLGTFEDILEMPKKFEYSKTFFKRWYTPDNTQLIIVGDFDDAKVMAQVEKSYGPWKGTVAKLVIPLEPPQKEARAVKVAWPSPTLPRAGFAWHSPAASPRTTDAAVQEVLSAYLVGQTSPLYRALVLDQQLVERLNAFYEHHRDPSLFGIDLRLKAETNRDAASTALLAAIKEVADGKVDAKRLEDIKSHLKNRMLMNLETPGQVAELLALHLGVFGTPDAVDALYANVAKVSAKDLSAFAKKHLVDTNRTTMTFTVEVKGATK
jgi:zinc protease